MKSPFAILIVALFLVSNLHSIQSTAVARNNKNKSQLTSLLPPVAGRSLPNLETFVVTAIQSSTTLTAADKQSLLSDFFNLLYRSSSMGGLLKDLLAIKPAPVPPPPSCDRTLKVGMSAVDVTSDKFPLNYPTDQNIKCTYYISTDDGTGILSFFFSSNNQLDTGASLKLYDGPSASSTEISSNEFSDSTGPSATVVFISTAGAVGKWKFSVNKG